jgi:hypothetical protein
VVVHRKVHVPARALLSPSAGDLPAELHPVIPLFFDMDEHRLAESEALVRKCRDALLVAEWDSARAKG